MRNQQKLSVAIVGAGIGGLAVAAALRKYFIEPVIYEQAETLRPRRRRHPAEPECREGPSLARHRGAHAGGRVRAGDLAQPRRLLRQGHQRPSARPRGRGALRRALPDDASRRPARRAGVDRAGAEHPARQEAHADPRARRARRAHLCRRQRGRGRRRHRRRRRALARSATMSPGPSSRASPGGSPTGPRFRSRCCAASTSDRRAPSGGARIATS